jgi:WD40 repeat protein
VTGVAFSRDGEILATATASGNAAQLWDVTTHQQIGAPVPLAARMLSDAKSGAAD